ncbi:MAG: ACP phosphodiesterase [Planctomycetota bacterium]
MNWLAHLRLAPAEPLLRLGNLAGDFVRGLDITTLHPELQRGIAQHRAIDTFVDDHEVHRRSRGRFDVRFGRYAGVALDVFYDHFLARDWTQHGNGQPLKTFVASVHEDLRTHEKLLPVDLAGVHRRMRQNRWLEIYGTLAGIERVLRAMARRGRRTGPLATIGGELRRHYQEFDADFAELWPQLTSFATDLHGEGPSAEP